MGTLHLTSFAEMVDVNMSDAFLMHSMFLAVTVLLSFSMILIIFRISREGLFDIDEIKLVPLAINSVFMGRKFFANRFSTM